MFQVAKYKAFVMGDIGFGILAVFLLGICPEQRTSRQRNDLRVSGAGHTLQAAVYNSNVIHFRSREERIAVIRSLTSAGLGQTSVIGIGGDPVRYVNAEIPARLP